MSALGHKRTYAAQQAMSALPPKADMRGAKTNVRFSNRPVWVKRFQTADARVLDRYVQPSKMVHAALLLLMLEAVTTDLVSPSATGVPGSLATGQKTSVRSVRIQEL
jgi:hypothetical protein